MRRINLSLYQGCLLAQQGADFCGEQGGIGGDTSVAYLLDAGVRLGVSLMLWL